MGVCGQPFPSASSLQAVRCQMPWVRSARAVSMQTIEQPASSIPFQEAEPRQVANMDIMQACSHRAGEQSDSSSTTPTQLRHTSCNRPCTAAWMREHVQRKLALEGDAGTVGWSDRDCSRRGSRAGSEAAASKEPRPALGLPAGASAGRGGGLDCMSAMAGLTPGGMPPHPAKGCCLPGPKPAIVRRQVPDLQPEATAARARLSGMHV